MAKRTLGSHQHAISVQPVGMGAMSLTRGPFGPGPPLAQGIQTLQTALDGGTELINTASFYGGGANEELIGKALKGRPRDSFVIASKWGVVSMVPPNLTFDFSREGAFKSIDAQLARLGVSCIDVWILATRRSMSREVLEEALGATKELMAQGKVQHAGVSGLTPAEVRMAHDILPLTLVELEWSLFARHHEAELLPTCRELGIGILAYSPMGKGMLSGQLKRDTMHPQDFRLSALTKGTFMSSDNWAASAAMVDKVAELAKAKGCTAGQLALAWVLHRGPDVCIIPGTSSPKRAVENLQAAKIKLSQQDLADLEAAVVALPPAAH